MQKQISEKIQNLLMEIYELVIDLKIRDICKISMHILKLEEICFTHDFLSVPFELHNITNSQGEDIIAR